MILKTSVLLLFFLTATTFAQKEVLYKQVDTNKLFLEVHATEKIAPGVKRPALIFFFGGGWKGGNRSQFLKHAEYFAKQGLVCFLADYRTETKHGTTPFESLKDAKSVIRYLRKNAEKFGIDPNKIIASGGSAGGHLAAATALTKKYDETSDDLSVSCIPNALVLFNPVIDNGPGGYGYERIGNAYKDFSPLHNIEKGAPPTILFLGTEDKLIPVAAAEYYKTVMEKVGSRCELKIYEGGEHGFFNYPNLKNYKQTISETDEFLQSLGYLEETPKLTIE